MKTQHKKLYTALFGGILFFAVVAAPLVPAATTHALECGILPKNICKAADATGAGNVETTGTWMLLKLAIQIMTAGVAIAAMGGLVYAAVLYTSAGPNQEQLKKAKGIILNVVIGVVAFALMFAVLQWLVPGGVF